MRAPSLRAAMVVVALVAFAAAAVAVDVPATFRVQTTADEPHYLVTALSIAQDGDLDVRPQYERNEYRPFYAITLAPQARPQPDGRLVEPHDPLLPVLIAIPTAIGGWALAKLTLCLFAAAVATLTLWTSVRRFDVPVLPAALVAGVLGASAPLAAYGTQVYPEIVGALATVAGVAALTGPLRRGGIAVLVIAIVALPWLAVKYAPVAVALALLGLWRLWRGGRPRAAGGLALGLAAAAVAFLVVHEALYGGTTPYAAGSYFVDGQLQVIGSHPDYLGRSRRLVGLFVDRDFGIAAWQPAWLALIPALGALAGRRPPGALALALPLAAGWFTATFLALTMQGWWFPGRQLVVVLPLAAIAIAWWVRAGGWRLVTFLCLGAVGVLAQGWIVAEGLRGDLAWVVNLQATANPLYRAWRRALPDYLNEDAATWVLHWGWAALAVVVAVLAYLDASARSSSRWRSSMRRILPVRVFGRSSTNSISRG